MAKKEIREQIIYIIQSVLAQRELNFGILECELNDNTNLSVDLGMDSIEIITVIAEIERVFDIEFNYDDMEIENITMFGNIVRSLEQVLLSRKC